MADASVTDRSGLRTPRRVLVVAYYFPPLGGIGSMRTSRFAQDLESYGWQATVLAPSAGSYHRDPELTFPEERVIRSPSFELSRVAKRALHTGGDDVTPASPGPVAGALRKLARNCIYYPDAQIGWYLPALRAGLRALRGGRFDLIFSTAYPMTSHLVARRLHHAAKLPWVAEYRDPFSDLVHPAGLNWRRADRLEHAIAGDASQLVMTAPSWASFYGHRWGRPIEVITNGSDGSVAPAPEPKNLVVSHLGSMFPERHHLGGLCQALQDLRTSGESPRLRFIGRLPERVRTEIGSHGLGDIVEEAGFLPHGQAMAALAASTVALVLGHAEDSPVLRGAIPAKVFEYLSTDLPILYVGDLNADAAAILEHYDGCHLLAPDDAEGIIAALLASRGQRYQRDITDFTRTALAGQLARTFERALSGSSRAGDEPRG